VTKVVHDNVNQASTMLYFLVKEIKEKVLSKTVQIERARMNLDKFKKDRLTEFLYEMEKKTRS
jgi:hypothetical protein